jgi:CRP-like cAMP-binding protein
MNVPGTSLHLASRLESWELVVRRFARLANLSHAEQEALRRLATVRVGHRAGDVLQAEGDDTRRPRFILSGWAYSQRLLSDGRRIIFRFTVPGDGMGVYPSGPPPGLHTIVAATTVETVDAEPILAMIRAGQGPGLLRALATAARIDEMRQLDHIVRLGRQTAHERVAHFLLELYDRLAAVGIGEDQRFPLPLTQELMSDALGVSYVHVNRTLQQLRRDRRIELNSGVATLLERDQLVLMADYRAPPVPIGRNPLPA